MAGIFRNSLIYSIISCSLLIGICAPAAYVLARFIFPGNKLIQTGFVSAMGVPVVMIVLPLFLGVNGIWLATPAAELMALALSAFLFLKYRKKYRY